MPEKMCVFFAFFRKNVKCPGSREAACHAALRGVPLLIMKKLLALVLALVMTLGLATVGANAAFSDASSINYKEAVEVMNALGVLEGTDGAFNPSGILTREQAAKIITYMIIGKTSGDALTASVAPFADVAADRWSAGSIAYCANLNIIGGVGDNKFDPAGQLTGYAFAKMLLVALGYDPKIEGLVGSDWQINTAKLALSAGLTADLGSFALSAPITREQAAQMAFNTETATMVQYSNGVNVESGDGTKVTVNATRSEVGTVGETNAFSYTANAPAVPYTQFCERYASTLKLTTAGITDNFGRPAERWRYDSRNVGTYASAPVATYTAAVKGSEIYADLGNVSGAAATALAASIDGLAKGGAGASGTAIAAGQIGSGVSANFPESGRGVKTEAYYNNTTGALTVIQTRLMLAVATADYNTTSKNLSVTFYAPAGTAFSGSTISGTDYPVVTSAKEGDYFYVTGTLNAAGTTYTLRTVEAVPTGSVVSNVAVSGYKTGSTVTAGGTTYNYNGSVGVAAMYGTAMINGTYTLGGSATYDLILDPYGYVIGAKTHTSGNTAADYVFVKGAEVNSLGAQANLVFSDGTSKTVTVSKVITVAGAEMSVGGTVALNNTSNYALVASRLSYNRFYKFSVDKSGNYELTEIANTATNTANEQYAWAATGDAAATTTTGKSATPIAGTTANDKSILIADGKVYTGARNWPAIATASDIYFLNDSNGAVMFGYTATAGTNTASSDDYVFVFGNIGTVNPAATTNKDADGTTYYEYDAVKNGELVKLDATSGSAATKAAGVYVINQYSDGYANLAAPAAVSVVSDANKNFAGGVYAGTGLYANNNGLAPAAIKANSGTLTDGTANLVLSENAKFYLIDQYADHYGANLTEISASAASNLAAGTAATYDIFAIQTSATDTAIAAVIIVRTAA